ncbi:MAG: enoyl-CoA hydratase/carnithine racemase [Glaciecola sp.]
MSDLVSYEVIDGVALITIERPEVHNAMSVEVFDALGDHARRAGEDATVGAVVVSGRGGSFSSGLDISALAGSGTLLDDTFIERLQSSFTAFEEIDKPTIAAIEGYCYGGGIQLAAACHLRAVSPTARLSVLERRWGLVPDLGGSWRLPRLVGLGRATELTLTARKVGAVEALAIGLAEISLPEQGAQEAALEFARSLASGPGAVRRAPRLLRENFGKDRESSLAREREAQLACLSGPDVAEAIGAALEGRDPSFVGR